MVATGPVDRATDGGHEDESYEDVRYAVDQGVAHIELPRSQAMELELEGTLQQHGATPDNADGRAAHLKADDRGIPG